MPNANYVRGTRFERQVMQEWTDKGYTVLRTAGSRGFADLVAIRGGEPVRFIQCKCFKTGSKLMAQNLVKQFLKHPRVTPSEHYVQSMEVYAMKDQARVEGTI